ncbi:MAG TPA: GIY-YIG nuclease family protein [Trebonia sp.]|jgi:hypothetical protein
MTDDVYVFKSPSRPGELKIGHSGDRDQRLVAARTWLEQGTFIAEYPGGGYAMEQWLHRQLEAAGYERDGRTEWFRCDLRAVQLAVNVAEEADVEFVARAVAEQRKQEAARQRLTGQQVQRQLALGVRDAALHEAQVARESAQQAQRSSQPRYERPLPRLPREREK